MFLPPHFYLFLFTCTLSFLSFSVSFSTIILTAATAAENEAALSYHLSYTAWAIFSGSCFCEYKSLFSLWMIHCLEWRKVIMSIVWFYGVERKLELTSYNSDQMFELSYNYSTQSTVSTYKNIWPGTQIHAYLSGGTKIHTG